MYCQNNFYKPILSSNGGISVPIHIIFKTLLGLSNIFLRTCDNICWDIVLSDGRSVEVHTKYAETRMFQSLDHFVSDFRIDSKLDGRSDPVLHGL
jgi:hypothetical protein